MQCLFVPKILFLLLISSFLSGCTHYLYTESTVSLKNSIAPPKIIKAWSYSSLSNSMNTIAIVAPDLCRKQSAMTSSTHQQDFIRTLCGVEIGIIEKEFIIRGYSVVSWEMLESESQSESKSYLQSSKELDVDILFIINSLENITANSSNVNLERKYYKSDDKGYKGAPWNLGEIHKKEIRKQLKLYEGGESNLSLGAAIDVTAIEVKTGKSIWFYQSSFYDLEKVDNVITAAFSGKKNIWVMFQLNGIPVKRAAQNIDNGSTEKENKVAQISDDIFIKYLKIAVSSFISSFQEGE